MLNSNKNGKNYLLFLIFCIHDIVQFHISNVQSKQVLWQNRNHKKTARTHVPGVRLKEAFRDLEVHN